MTGTLGAAAMADHSIIFSAVMVEGLLAGLKDQTRRLAWRPLRATTIRRAAYRPPSPWQNVQPGDRLWVREAFALPANWTRPMANIAGSCLAAGYSKVWAPIHYFADGAQVNWGDWREHAPGKTRPPIHMPRWASRITLEVTGVRVERLQEISATDARAEGIQMPAPTITPDEFDHDCVVNYRLLWEQINGPGSWDANPWVWVIKFSKSRTE